jgi:hypothetical protein
MTLAYLAFLCMIPLVGLGGTLVMSVMAFGGWVSARESLRGGDMSGAAVGAVMALAFTVGAFLCSTHLLWRLGLRQWPAGARVTGALGLVGFACLMTGTLFYTWGARTDRVVALLGIGVTCVVLGVCWVWLGGAVKKPGDN